jgi:hypothetical protein
MGRGCRERVVNRGSLTILLVLAAGGGWWGYGVFFTDAWTVFVAEGVF